MTETINNFFNRAYIDFVNDRALIYPVKIGKLEPDKWTIHQARDYIKYLEENDRT